jgi:hypothetical protein
LINYRPTNYLLLLIRWSSKCMLIPISFWSFHFNKLHMCFVTLPLYTEFILSMGRIKCYGEHGFGISWHSVLSYLYYEYLYEVLLGMNRWKMSSVFFIRVQCIHSFFSVNTPRLQLKRKFYFCWFWFLYCFWSFTVFTVLIFKIIIRFSKLTVIIIIISNQKIYLTLRFRMTKINCCCCFCILYFCYFNVSETFELCQRIIKVIRLNILCAM